MRIEDGIVFSSVRLCVGLSVITITPKPLEISSRNFQGIIEWSKGGQVRKRLLWGARVVANVSGVLVLNGHSEQLFSGRVTVWNSLLRYYPDTISVIVCDSGKCNDNALKKLAYNYDYSSYLLYNNNNSYRKNRKVSKEPPFAACNVREPRHIGLLICTIQEDP